MSYIANFRQKHQIPNNSVNRVTKDITSILKRLASRSGTINLEDHVDYKSDYPYQGRTIHFPSSTEGRSFIKPIGQIEGNTDSGSNEYIASKEFQTKPIENGPLVNYVHESSSILGQFQSELEDSVWNSLNRDMVDYVLAGDPKDERLEKLHCFLAQDSVKEDLSTINGTN
ncbi:uncharacterized protein L201_001210 [Kwoniella dendrophila CBS 6074]|uniref:Uncharacterized protein n=1 Tax=Kwoniella dendrophila CBS 6074 TaxID=1295534 RepID=A0AAX4JND4_9TREE